MFHRYLQDWPQSVHGTVVVTPPQAGKKKDTQRFAEFFDVSSLYGTERRFDKYRLLALRPVDFHARWLCADNQLFQLDGSLKDVEQRFSISPINPFEQNFAKVQDALNVGVEMFGPTCRQHTAKVLDQNGNIV